MTNLKTLLDSLYSKYKNSSCFQIGTAKYNHSSIKEYAYALAKYLDFHDLINNKVIATNSQFSMANSIIFYASQLLNCKLVLNFDENDLIKGQFDLFKKPDILFTDNNISELVLTEIPLSIHIDPMQFISKIDFLLSFPTQKLQSMVIKKYQKDFFAVVQKGLALSENFENQFENELFWKCESSYLKFTNSQLTEYADKLSEKFTKVTFGDNESNLIQNQCHSIESFLLNNLVYPQFGINKIIVINEKTLKKMNYDQIIILTGNYNFFHEIFNIKRFQKHSNYSLKFCFLTEKERDSAFDRKWNHLTGTYLQNFSD